MTRLLRLGAAIGLLLLAFSGSLQAAPTYSNNFESNANGMSGYGFLDGTQGYSAYGFGNAFWRNDAAGSPAASSFLTFTGSGNSTLDLDLAIIDSWDGANCCGPDILHILLDGNSIFSANFDLFVNPNPTVAPGLTTIFYGNHAGFGPWVDQGYHLALSLGSLSGGTHTLEFFADDNTSGNGFQGGGDESFAIDNVVINTANVPEPATISLLVMGLFGVGATARRRRS